MSYKTFRAALGCASLLAVAAGSTAASAQQVDRIVALGDSYADIGNAFRLGYANPSALQVYPTGRFSGGTNYIDTLAKLLDVPAYNYAIGGAFGGSNNGTLCYDATYGAPLCGKGLQYEVDQYLNVGTQSAVFPTAGTTLTRNDLLAISIGGNDARSISRPAARSRPLQPPGLRPVPLPGFSSTAWLPQAIRRSASWR
jgi:phospholipase/lecithinase/hemolysin